MLKRIPAKAAWAALSTSVHKQLPLFHLILSFLDCSRPDVNHEWYTHPCMLSCLAMVLTITRVRLGREPLHHSWPSYSAFLRCQGRATCICCTIVLLAILIYRDRS